MPPIVVLDASGLRIVEGPASWEALATFEPGSNSKLLEKRLSEGPLREAADFVGKPLRDGAIVGTSAHDIVAQIMAVELGDPREPPRPTTDCPPERPGTYESVGDDDLFETERRGMAMALDEGKMPNPGAKDKAHVPVGPQEDRRGDAPRRQLNVAGEIAEDGTLTENQIGLLIASPTTPAKLLIAVLGSANGMMIGVRNNGGIRPLRLDLKPLRRDPDPGDDHWMEVRIGPAGLDVELVPDTVSSVPWKAGPIDLAALTKARDAVLAAHRLKATVVDVLVDPTTDTQRLVDVLVALDGIGVRSMGIGLAPTCDEAKKRGHRIPIVKFDSQTAEGDLEQKAIRTPLKAHLADLKACYATALAAAPTLSGKIAVQFVISPAGAVDNARAAGVDPGVSTCMAKVISGLTFSKPRGTVQVNVAITATP